MLLCNPRANLRRSDADRSVSYSHVSLGLSYAHAYPHLLIPSSPHLHTSSPTLTSPFSPRTPITISLPQIFTHHSVITHHDTAPYNMYHSTPQHSNPLHTHQHSLLLHTLLSLSPHAHYLHTPHNPLTPLFLLEHPCHSPSYPATLSHSTLPPLYATPQLSQHSHSLPFMLTSSHVRLP